MKNTELLIKRREALIEEIRRVDPAGAEAIIRADSNFCQCAQHEGYLIARRKFVGHLPTRFAPPAIVDASRDTLLDRQRLEQLEAEQVDLKRQLDVQKPRRIDLQTQKSALIQRRDQLRVTPQLDGLRNRVGAIDLEINAINQRISGTDE